MFEPGDLVDVMDHGYWEGPFKVVSFGMGRTVDHLILEGPFGNFEQFNDFPYNIRHHVL